MKKVTRIIYISHQHLPENAPLQNYGGMQRVSVQLLNELKKRDDVKIKPILMYATHKRMGPPSTVFWIKTWLSLPFIVLAFRPHAILFTSMVTAGMVGLNRPFIHVPMISINHGHDVTMPSLWYQLIWLPLTLRLLNGTISVSQATREETIKRGMKPENALVVPNGFDIDQWDLTMSKSEAREKLVSKLDLKVSKDTKILLTVGRQVKRKGHAWFIEKVFPKIKSDVIYLAIGSGAEHEHLQKLRESLDYKAKIYLPGRMSDEILKLAYRGSDLFIMPNIPVTNDMEGFGVVMLEANINNTPSIASNIEGIKDVIKNGHNGYKVRVGDAKKFAQKIDEVCKDENLLKNLQKSSSEYVMQNFSWKDVSDKYVKSINFLIQQYKENMIHRRIIANGKKKLENIRQRVD